MDFARVGEAPRRAAAFFVFFAAAFFFFATGLRRAVFLVIFFLCFFIFVFRPDADRTARFVGFFRFFAIVRPLLCSD